MLTLSRLPVGVGHNGGAADGDREVSGVLLQHQILGDRFAQRVRVGPAEQLGVAHFGRRFLLLLVLLFGLGHDLIDQFLSWPLQGIDPLLDLDQVAVGVGGGDVDDCLEKRSGEKVEI